MKVLLVAPQPFYQERGTPIAVRLLAETLCDLGHEVDLLVYHAGTDIVVPGLRLIRAARPPGVRDVPIGASWRKLACDVTLVAQMIRLLTRQRYDVIHAVEEAIFPAAVLRSFAGCELVYDMDSSLSDQVADKWPLVRPLGPVLRAIEWFAVRRSTAVFAVCEDLAVKVRPWLADGRVVVLPDVPLGVDKPVDRVDPLRGAAPQDAVIGLYVGNLEDYQGIDLLLDSIAQLPATSNLVTFVIGGDPVGVARYRRRAEDLGVAERVRFLGARPVAHLGAYLEQADILISPRILGQNTPMKIYSYMQSGRAILATCIRSHTQALDERCAELVPLDAARFAAGLERLGRDALLRQRLGDAARGKAEREYSLPVFRRKFADAYAKLGGEELKGALQPTEAPDGFRSGGGQALDKRAARRTRDTGTCS